MQRAQAPADVFGFVLIPPPRRLQPIPRVELNDARAVPHHSNFRHVEKPIERRPLFGMRQKQISVVNPQIGAALLVLVQILLELAGEQGA